MPVHQSLELHEKQNNSALAHQKVVANWHVLCMSLPGIWYGTVQRGRSGLVFLVLRSLHDR